MRFLGRRVGLLVVTLWVAMTVNFAIPRLMPGNPALAMMARLQAQQINASVVKALDIAFGVKQHSSLVSQYVQYLRNSVTGHFGVSLTFYPEPVSRVIVTALPWTLGLVGVTTVMAFALGTILGTIAGVRRGGLLDGILPPVLLVASAFPYFWVALLLILGFSLSLHWVPLGFGYNTTQSASWTWSFIEQVLRHSILPGLSILLTSIGGWILIMRNNVITTLAEDYVRMARAKGLSPLRIMFDYTGRNAVLPSLTGFAMSLGFVISGGVLVEYVFSYPGLGYTLLQAVQNEDYPLMQTLFLMITVAVLVAVFVADILVAVLDPRTRAAA